MRYLTVWDLSSIPEDVFNAEAGRRRRAKGPKVTYAVMKPCRHCKKLLTSTQRRGPCPHCKKGGNRDA